MSKSGQVLDNKHIGVMHYTLPPAISGVEMIIRDHSRLLDDRGYKIHLLGARGKNIRKSIKIQLARSFDPKLKRVYLVQEELKKGLISEEFQNLKNLYKKIILNWIKVNELSCVIVHNILTRHYNLALTAAAIEVANETRKKIKWITWVHDASFIDTYYTNLNPKLKTKFPWSLIANKQKDFQYVTVSKTRKKELLAIFGQDKKIKVIQNGLDINKMLPLPLQTRELFRKVSSFNPDYVGIIPVRITERKNIEFAIEFAKTALRKFDKNFVFIVTGAVHQQNFYAKKYFEFLKKLINENHLQNHFILLSEFILKHKKQFNINIVNMRDLYLISDFLFLPSLGEGFGLPIIEAGFMRIPIFCSNLPVFKEVGNGYINSFQLEKPINETVDMVLNHLQRRRTTLFRKQVLQKYDFDKIVDQDLIPFLTSK